MLVRAYTSKVEIENVGNLYYFLFLTLFEFRPKKENKIQNFTFSSKLTFAKIFFFFFLTCYDLPPFPLPFPCSKRSITTISRPGENVICKTNSLQSPSITTKSSSGEMLYIWIYYYPTHFTGNHSDINTDFNIQIRSRSIDGPKFPDYGCYYFYFFLMIYLFIYSKE